MTAHRWARADLHGTDGGCVIGWALETMDDPPVALAFVVPRADGQYAALRAARQPGGPFHVARSLDEALATAQALAGVEWA